MASYDQLDINQKINTKAALQAWAKYSVQNFQKELDKKVYGLRTTKRGVQRSSLVGYRYGSGRSRTNNLRKAWWQNVQAGSGTDRVMIEFLMYGRFVDMGVGRGVTHTSRVVNRQLRLGRSGRTRKTWYSKTKGHEIHRLREILAEQNIHMLLDSIENALNISVSLNL